LNTYISWFDYQRSTTGLEYLSLLGNTGRLSGTTTLGSTTLNVIPNLTVQINQYDIITIFDGSNSENVTATGTALVGASTIPVTATQFAHVAGTPFSTDGVLGSLAEAIIRSSQYLETICKQSLFQTTYTNEQLAMPTMRASIDNQYALHFRPRHWPIQSLTALSITTTVGDTIQYDPTQVIIDSDKQICSMPNMQPLPLPGSGQAPYPIWNVTGRYREAQVTITYVAGFSTLPSDVIEASVLLTSDILAKRENPIGALDVSSGTRHISAAIRGEATGDSILFKRARKILDNYTVQAF
jgi:hypothetical protein